jgi:hypothetical protein
MASVCMLTALVEMACLRVRGGEGVERGGILTVGHSDGFLREFDGQPAIPLLSLGDVARTHVTRGVPTTRLKRCRRCRPAGTALES